MQPPEEIKVTFVSALMYRAQYLIDKRKRSNLSQSNMAHYCGVSLKTIQRFETMRQENAYLCFAYEKVLNSQCADSGSN